MKYKYIVILMFLVFLLNTVNSTFSAPAGYDTLENWEGFVAGTVNDTGAFGSFTLENYLVSDNLGVRFQEERFSGDYSYYMRTSDDNTDNHMFLNYTFDDFDYIGGFNIWFYIEQHETSWDAIIFHFYNSSDTEVITFRNNYPTASRDTYIIDNGGNKHYFYDYYNIGDPVLDEDQGIWFNFTHVSDNIMTYSLWTENDGTISFEDTCRKTATSWDTFKNLSIELIDEGGADAQYYIDDIYITQESASSTSFSAMTSGLNSRCSNPLIGTTQVFYPWSTDTVDWLCVLAKTLGNLDYSNCITGDVSFIPTKYVEWESENRRTERIRHVLLPVDINQLNEVSNNLNHYNMVINGDSYGSPDDIVNYGWAYGLVWYNVNKTINNYKPLFAFSSSQTTSGFTRDWYWYGLGMVPSGNGMTTCHNNPNLFLDNSSNGYYMNNGDLVVCWYYDNSNIEENEESNDEETQIIEDYDNYFGNGTGGSEGKGYIEFDEFSNTCDYTVGDSPSIVYNLSNNMYPNHMKNILYRIRKVRNSGVDSIEYTGIIEIGNNLEYRRGFRDLPDFSFGSVGTYYIEAYNTTNNYTETLDIVHRSRSIRVCSDESGDTYVGIPSFRNFLHTYLSTEILFIIGMFIISCITFMPFIVASKLKSSKHSINIEVPNVLYGIMFSIGTVIVYTLGFIGFAIMFFLLVMLALIILLVYFTSQKSKVAEGE